jgi:hypothetical protein
MFPRFTVSGHTADASTVGAAGFNRATANAVPAKTTTPTPAHINIWRCFFRFMSGRAISIAREELHVQCQSGLPNESLKI